MNKIFKLALIAAILGSVSCNKDGTESKIFKIDGLTIENYPKVDGSTSAQPLQTLIACKLLGISYEWSFNPMLMHYTLYPPYQDEEAFLFILNNVRNTGTHSSIINLIEGNADFIITARGASEPEKNVAKDNNVKLLEIPVAIDAFIMIVNKDNPVNSLTTKQIQDIYTGEITNWVDVGGNPAKINPYRRNSTSGSQVLMESLIMKDLIMKDFPELNVSPTMWGPFDLLSHDKDGLCYTVYYYHEFMARAEAVKSISVDGVRPEFSTLQNRQYPYTTDVYVMIREDLDKSSIAYNLYHLLFTKSGRKVIEESGYVPY